ncbi:DedA family protein [Candidatus Haliotispira prima]|uniref:DedA family protein n=1 Tax=Candidatus Haliotispira prima TaxID=3034016 RepID=A0ABY8MF37_9SPIO|nr:DedA family protein [Candidatus Haliotispira prima]
MQESLANLLTQYAAIAPLIVFLALVIAAFNIPISEDLTVIAAGAFIAAMASHQTSGILRPSILMHVALISGAVSGDMVSYAMGRKIGRPLLEKRFFRRVMPPHRLEFLSRHFAKHSALTILLGRLIPFGIRNAISLFAGIARLPAWKFLLLDTIPSSFSISIIYFLSRHYSHHLLQNIRTVQKTLLLILLLFIGYMAFRIYSSAKRSRAASPARLNKETRPPGVHTGVHADVSPERGSTNDRSINSINTTEENERSPERKTGTTE